MTTPTSITGVDGVSPVYAPDRIWTIWNINDMYVGGIGNNKFVSNVNDLVFDMATGEQFIVVEVDQTTLIARWVLWNKIPSQTVDQVDVLLGPSPGVERDTYIAYIDKSVIPYTLCVDARLKIHATTATKAKIFWENNLTGNQEVVSAFYDQSGNLLGQEVPLELVDMPNGQNFATKALKVCYTTREIADGDYLTVVCYSDDGMVRSKAVVLAENSAFIRNSNTAAKYVMSIALESPFLSESDPTLIEYPLNVPLAGLNLIGVVTYSDGSKIRLPVDQTKFSVYGIQDQGYISTVIGQAFPVVLRYLLSPGEFVYGATVGENKVISRQFNARTIQANGAYTVKLFVYPVWIDALHGYRLTWRLYNLDRNISYDATAYVKMNDNSLGFDPLAYNVRQNLTVSVNLNDINGIFKSYKHVQTVDVTLLTPGTARTTNWTIGYSPSQNPPYGRNNFAATTFVNQNLTTVKVDMGATDVNDWLNRIVAMTQPLTDPQKEATWPAPNFFALVIGGQDVEFPISQWNSQLTVNQAIPDSSTLFIKFYKKTADNILQISIAGIPVYQNVGV